MDTLPEDDPPPRYSSNVWKFYIYKSFRDFTAGLILPITFLFFFKKT